MKDQYHEFFERCCEQRFKGWLSAEALPGQSQQEAVQLGQLMTYLDQTCLDLASKRLLMKEDLVRIDQNLLESGRIERLPTLPVWLFLDSPQPVFGVDPADEGDPWAHERIAAAFFYAPYSTEVLSRALVPPIGDRPFPKTMQAPHWHEWRLDLIDPDGIFFSALQYYYDERTGRWRKMEGSTCPVDECSLGMDPELGYPTIIPCQLCLENLDYYSQWLATSLSLQLGQPLSLKSPAWEIRKRAIFSSPGQKKSRTFKGRIQKRKKRK